LFDWKYDCTSKRETLIESGHTRIQNIIRCSKVYGDSNLYFLEEKLANDSTLIIKCHKSCVSIYTSKTTTDRHKRKHSEPDSSDVPKEVTRRSTDTSIFSFLQQCMFCGDQCVTEKDPKNPSRWRPAYVCRKVCTHSRQISFKQTIINTCTKRNDKWAEIVRGRIEGALSDLHAAGARYHVDCRADFFSENSVACACTTHHETGLVDEAFDTLVSLLKDDQSKVWNSMELFQVYTDNGGTLCFRETLVKRLCEHFGNDILVLHSPGLANVIMFRRKAAESMKLVNDKEDDTNDLLSALSKKIANDIESVNLDKHHYETEIDCTSAIDNVSGTLLDLLSKLSPKLDRTLPAILIGSILTSIVKNYPTGLQVALGVKMGRSKQLVSLLKEFGVTCTYDELQRFKRSAAKAATADCSLTGLADSSSGLVQVIADNFDADISSQNGKLSTHSLAVLVTQPDPQTPHVQEPNVIKRLRKEEMSESLEYDVDIQRYNGPSKPLMPKNAAQSTVIPLSILCQQVISTNTAEKQDFAFLHDVVVKENIPEFNGYNTALSREKGNPIKQKTKSVYLPLIDMTPSHPDTMMTAMAKAQELTYQTGQDFVVFTCDLQLYKVAQEVKWAYPVQFENVVLRLGGSTRS